MAWYSAFTTTGSISRAFLTTSGGQTFLISAGSYKAFSVTAANQPYLISGGVAAAFAITAPNIVFPVVGGSVTAFLVTPQPDPTKLLILKNNQFEFNTDYTVTTVYDETGVYDATTNPNGYQPPLDPPDPLRPYRSDLNLWTVYRLKSGDAPNQIVFPTSQAEQADPDYAYPLDTSTKGIYDILMVGAPSTEVYDDYLNQNIQEYAASRETWFVTSTWVTIDPDLDKCLINKRWEFINSVMCGRCNPEYLELYALYVAMNNANYIQSPTAVVLYDKLKQKCSENPDCNTCC